MWLKIITLVGAALSLYFMLGRFMGGAQRDAGDARAKPARGFGRAPRRQGVEDLIECPRCGAFRNSAELCDCEKAPVP